MPIPATFSMFLGGSLFRKKKRVWHHCSRSCNEKIARNTASKFCRLFRITTVNVLNQTAAVLHFRAAAMDMVRSCVRRGSPTGRCRMIWFFSEAFLSEIELSETNRGPKFRPRQDRRQHYYLARFSFLFVSPSLVFFFLFSFIPSKQHDLSVTRSISSSLAATRRIRVCSAWPWLYDGGSSNAPIQCNRRRANVIRTLPW